MSRRWSLPVKDPKKDNLGLHHLKDAAHAVAPAPGLVLIRTVRGLSAAPAV